MTNPTKTTELAVRKAIAELPGRFRFAKLVQMTGCKENSIYAVLRRLIKDGEIANVGECSTIREAIDKAMQAAAPDAPKETTK
jgi:hypothetical protein